MRKQWIALLLCLCLLTGCLSAAADVAVQESTQLDKLIGHWKSSCFQGTLTGTASQEKPSFMDASVWAAIQAYLQNYTLSFLHTNQNPTADLGSESVLTLTNASGTVSIRNILVEDHSGIRYVRSPLLDDSIYYAFAPSNDAVSLALNALNDSAWPSLLHVLYSIFTADESWKERAKPHYDRLTAELNKWMMNYYKTTPEVDASGRQITNLDYVIPANALLQETKQMLIYIISNQELSSLLREILTVDEQAAYLQTDMIFSFMSMIDRVNLKGDIVIRRQYSMDQLLYESMQIPFAETAPVSQVSIVHTVEGSADKWQLRAELAKAPYTGALIEVSGKKMDAGIWVGDVKWTPGQTPDSVTEPDTLTFEYNLEWDGVKDVNDVYANRYERTMGGTLVVKPDETLHLPVMSLTLKDARIYSKEAKLSSPVYVVGTLEWVDLESNASITLSLDGRTSTRQTPLYIDEAISSSLRLDMLDAESRSVLIQSLLHNLPARFIQLTGAPLK